MALTYNPVWPWPYIVTVLAGLTAVFLLGRGAVNRWAGLGCSLKTRLAVLLLSLMAALLFTVASFNPCYSISRAKPGKHHLAIVVDVSESVKRADGGWPQVHHQARQLVTSIIETMPGETVQQGTASIVTFGRGSVVAEPGSSLADLPAAFNRLQNDTNFAPGGESDISAGLNRAADLIEQAGGRGAVLLISDGNETMGHALNSAKRLARQGIPIYIHPVRSLGPELSITAANLPRQVNANAETFVRGMLMNSRLDQAAAILAVDQNPGLDDSTLQFGIGLASEAAITIPAGSWARLRQPLVFQGFGLQFVDLSLTPAGGEGQHRRRFFTHVNSPPKILAIGGDNRWAAVLPSNAATVIEINPEELSTKEINLEEFEVIVISSVWAGQFPAGVLADIARAVEQNGLGLMVINGGHLGLDNKAETVLMSYNDTPLESLLPLLSDPEGPDKCQVVILIDASGSMSGIALEKSKQIARHIIQNLLQPEDHLDLITFTAGARHLVKDRAMGEGGKAGALKQIDLIAASGGTDPREALALIAERKMTNCKLIFISDGQFDRVTDRPDCRATVFAIDRTSISTGDPLWEFGEVYAVSDTFDPRDIQILCEEQKNFFEPGRFIPRPLNRYGLQGKSLPLPELELEGTAVTYRKEDADLIAVRPKLANPVLAYRDSGAGSVGAFTTEIPQAWLENKEGRPAIAAWITRLGSYMARDRYDFKLTDLNQAIEIQISLVARDGNIPKINHLAAKLEIKGQAPIEITLRPVPKEPATFKGYIHVPRGDQTQKARLILSESGPDALLHPQDVPILIPPAGKLTTSLPTEAYTYGLNEPLLRAIAQAGAGIFDPAEDTLLFRDKPAEKHDKSLWPLLLVIAVSCYFAAITLHRLNL